MIVSPRLAALAALAFTVGLAGCATREVKPTLSKAVIEARTHKDAPASAACPALEGPASVTFAFAEAGLSELVTPTLERLTRQLACHPGVAALIVGQADNHGTDAEQRQLAQARITAVSEYLRAHNIAAERLQAQVLGEPPAPDPRRIVVLAEGRRW